MLSVGVAAEVFSVCVLLHGGGAVDSTEKHLKSEGSTVFVTQQQEKGESDRRRLGAPRSTQGDSGCPTDQVLDPSSSQERGMRR